MSQRPVRNSRSWLLSLQRRLFFAGGSFLHSLGLYSVSFEENDLLGSARERTGLSDFGDTSFLPALREMTKSIKAEAGLSFSSQVAERFLLIEILKRRLYIQRDLTHHPEILQERIAKPIFILGMPRSGTTLLQNLLHTDPGARWLRPWEIEEPWPNVQAGVPDLRERAFLRRLEQSRATANEMDRIHALDSPADCDLLFLPTFYANLQTVALHTPSYDRWLEERPEDEWRRPYVEYRAQLQRQQWYRRPLDHWVLKSPIHLGHLPALRATFPDARLIHLHRDPKKTVPSTCSMVAVQRKERTGKADGAQIGRFISERLASRVERAMQTREEVPASQVIDIRYPDLLRDPIGTVRRIYGHFGLEVSPEMERGMETHLKENPQHKRGVHRYQLGDFGLSAEDLDRRFAAYCSRFGIATE